MAGKRALPEVDAFFEEAAKWRAEMQRLRAIVGECELEEEFKWRQPCYTVGGKNVVIISAFKDYCALNFFKGALLDDPERLLVSPGPRTQEGRQLRFTSVAEIAAVEPAIESYVREAIEVGRAGLKLDPRARPSIGVPAEFQERLDDSPDLRVAFAALTPGRRRAYAFYFSDPKRPSTRAARVEKMVPRILDGKGLND